MRSFCEIARRWISELTFDNNSTLVHVALSWTKTADYAITCANVDPLPLRNMASPGREQSVYHQIYNIRRTKSHNLTVSRLALQLPFCNLLKPGVKFWMKMWLEQRRQAMLQLHLSDQWFNCLLRCACIRGLTVYVLISSHRNVSIVLKFAGVLLMNSQNIHFMLSTHEAQLKPHYSQVTRK